MRLDTLRENGLQLYQTLGNLIKPKTAGGIKITFMSAWSKYAKLSI
jgi:hypothetical protein